MANSKSNSMLNKNFLVICIINFALNMGQFLCNTLVPRYANALGASVELVGFISSAFSITALLTKPFSAPAIDSLKKKLVLGCGLVIGGLAFIGYSFATTATMIIVFRLLHGVSTGINTTTCLTMVSDTVPEEKLAQAISYFSMIQALSTAVGPSIGIALSDAIGYPITFRVSAACQILAVVVLVLFYNQADKTPRKPFKVRLSGAFAKEALMPAFVMLFLAATYSTISAYLVNYAEGMGISGIGTFFTVYAVALLVCRPLVAQLSAKKGPGRLLPIAIVFFAAGMIVIGVARNLTMFLVSAVLVAFGYGACQPITQALCITCAPPERRGAASSTSYYGTDLGYLLAPVIFGSIAGKFSYSVMYFTTVISLAIALTIYFTNRSKFVTDK